MTAPRGLTAATTALFSAPKTLATAATPRVAVASPTPPSAGSPGAPADGGTIRRNRKSAKSAAPDISENELLSQVRKLAKLTGWETYHTHNSQRSESGWPDLVLASATQRRTLFVELKKHTGKVSEAQQKWLDLLALCGHEVTVWRPADMPEIAKVLRGQRIDGAS